MQVLVVAAHPDDETAFAGGMIAKYAAEGHAVHVLWTTRGEGGEMGNPPLTTRDRLGAVREAEARAAAAALGVQHVHFLPFTDPVVGPEETLFPIDAPLELFSHTIAAVMAELRPDLIVTHGSGGEYGHPQHIFTHQAVLAALEELKPWQPAEVLTWSAMYPAAEIEKYLNKNNPADIVLDVTPWLAQKIAAFNAHATQHVLFFRHNQGKTIAEIPGRVESFHRWPAFARNK
jgi:LmbE family N-acetylglucosaminyl deacetylase